MKSVCICWTAALLVIGVMAKGILGQRNRNGGSTSTTATSALCGEYGAILRDQRCIYPALADCRRKPTDTTRVALFQCPEDTSCEPITGLCVCQGEYRNAGDDSGILTCIRGQNYGQPCNATATCLGKFDCSNELCSCPQPGHWNSTEGECLSEGDCKAKHPYAYYDELSRKCVCPLIDNDCGTPAERLGLSCPVNSIRSYDIVSGQFRYHCQCKSGLVASSSRRSCLSKLGYEASCTAGTSDACDTDKHLSCRGGKCECDSGTRAWHPGVGECKLKAGQSCAAGRYGMTLYGQCVENAECNPRYLGSDDRRCECDTGFGGTSNGLCRGWHGTGCSTRRTCLEYLDCIEGACDCRDQINTKYEDGGCKIVIGSPCNSTSTCVEHATCSPTRSVCEPEPGFRLSPTSRTELMAAFGYGEACTKSTCDFDRGYTCQNGKCACADSSLTYRGSQQGCLAPVGHVCGSQAAGRGVYKISCDGKAECQRVSGGNEPARFACVAK